MARLRQQRIQSEELARRKKAHGRVPLVPAEIRDAHDPRQQEVDPGSLFVLIEDRVVLLERANGEMAGEPLEPGEREARKASELLGCLPVTELMRVPANLNPLSRFYNRGALAGKAREKMAMVYRRQGRADKWHFCSNCPQWPEADYEARRAPRPAASAPTT
jgi:hypothetical protein